MPCRAVSLTPQTASMISPIAAASPSTAVSHRNPLRPARARLVLLQKRKDRRKTDRQARKLARDTGYGSYAPRLTRVSHLEGAAKQVSSSKGDRTLFGSVSRAVDTRSPEPGLLKARSCHYGSDQHHGLIDPDHRYTYR
jgi:hypothetical protein